MGWDVLDFLHRICVGFGFGFRSNFAFGILKLEVPFNNIKHD
jgi:hypothetical protein